jgi:hypothetical protein
MPCRQCGWSGVTDQSPSEATVCPVVRPGEPVLLRPSPRPGRSRCRSRPLSGSNWWVCRTDNARTVPETATVHLLRAARRTRIRRVPGGRRGITRGNEFSRSGVPYGRRIDHDRTRAPHRDSRRQWAPQDERRSIRAARVALGWVVVFLGFHVYWYLGGSFGSPGKLPGEPHSLVSWIFNLLVDGAFALGLLVPLAISRGWAVGRLGKLVGLLAWLGGVLLLLRGGAGIVDDLARVTGILPDGITGISTRDTTGTTDPSAFWSGGVIDAYFLGGGMIFTWLAVRHRRSTRRRSDPRRARSTRMPA